MTMEAPVTAVNPSEIRLGNWFRYIPESYFGPNCDDVFQFTQKSWRWIAEIGIDIGSAISPIPITADILVKSGFAEVNTGTSWAGYSKSFGNSNQYQIDFFFGLNIEDSGLEIRGNSEFGNYETLIYLPHIKYVHQLQNIHYSITGQELEIKWI